MISHDDIDVQTDDPRCEYAAGTPEDEYRASVGLGSTDLRELRTSVRHWRHYRDEGIDETDSVKLGNYVHAAVLEPDRFEKDVLDYPDPPDDAQGLSSSKQQLAHLLADDETHGSDALSDEVGVQKSTIDRWAGRGGNDGHSGVLKLKDHIDEHGPAPDQELAEEAAAIRDVVWQHPRVQQLLDGTDTEASFWWGEDVDGTTYQCKGRADAVAQVGGQLVASDLKTTGRSIDPGSYARTLGRRNGHLQAAHYSAGLDATRELNVGFFVYLAVETSPPYDVVSAVLDDEALRAGRDRCRGSLRTLDDWMDDPDQWDGRSRNLEKLTLNQWEL